MEGKPFVDVGKIARSHGLRGEVKVLPLGDWPEGFRTFHFLYLNVAGRGRWVEVERERVQGEYFILKLSGVDDREGAEGLRGGLLKVRKDACPTLLAGTYYVRDLIGLDVVTVGGEKIGCVVDVWKMPAQDVYVVDVGGREVLIPAVKRFVKRVDIAAGIVTIDAIEGLLD